MAHQVRHFRTSIRGRKFAAGHGIKKNPRPSIEIKDEESVSKMFEEGLELQDKGRLLILRGQQDGDEHSISEGRRLIEEGKNLWKDQRGILFSPLRKNPKIILDLEEDTDIADFDEFQNELDKNLKKMKSRHLIKDVEIKTNPRPSEFVGGKGKMASLTYLGTDKELYKHDFNHMVPFKVKMNTLTATPVKVSKTRGFLN